MFSQSVSQTPQTPSQGQKRNLDGIDLVKFICAILVFIIHFPPFESGVSALTDSTNFILQQGLCRVAVPFYFVCSGFFLFRKMPLYDLNTNAIKEYCYKLLRLAATWYLLLSSFTVVDPLWYLSATVIAVIVLSVCLHFQLKLGCIWLLASILYVFGLLGDSYHGLVAPFLEESIVGKIYDAYLRLFGSTRNGVFMGFIFVLMGATLSQRKVTMKPLTAAIGLVLSLFVLTIEATTLERNAIPIEYNMYISLLPAVYFLFCFAYAVPLPHHSIYRHLRNIGMLIYFTHRFIVRAVYLSRGMLGQFYNVGIWMPLFVFGLPATLLAAVIYDWLSGKKKFKWLNWLIA